MANDKFQNAIARRPQAVPPVWFMRQAGRYHKHYQALRAKHTFVELCKMPEIAAEVAMGPIQDFDFDVAILFSDLLFPLEAMGMGLKYEPGPQLDWELTETRLKDLRPASEAIGSLKFQGEAMRETRRRLPKDKSLIGFVGGPWTLFTYAVEGAHKGSLEKSKKSLGLFKPFCDLLIPLLLQNIQLQLDGGAEVVMIFDTSAGELSPAVYRSEVIPQVERLTREFPKRLGYYAKGVQAAHLRHPWLGAKSELAGLGVDHRWEMSEALSQYRFGFVQGNFDQAMLFLSEAELKTWAERYLTEMKSLTPEQRAGWVSGLGHGVLPGTPEANVRTYIRMVREILA